MNTKLYPELVECAASYNTIYKIVMSEGTDANKLERIKNIIYTTEPELTEIKKIR